MIARTQRLPWTVLMIGTASAVMTACRGPEDVGQEAFTFTQDDIVRFQELSDADTLGTSGSGSAASSRGPVLSTNTGALEDIVLDLSDVERYQAVRAGLGGDEGSLYRVTNPFLNVRAEPRAQSAFVERLERGDTVDVAEFVNAGWAKIRSAQGREAYVAQEYIAKLVSEEGFAELQQQYNGTYFVQFNYVNVRSEPRQDSEKLGEIPGLSILKPIDITDGWAKVSFNGGEGYVSADYLSPFLPRTLVRQMTYEAPVLLYTPVADASNPLPHLATHIARLRGEGVKIITFRELRDIVLQQEDRDVRLDPNTVIIGVTDVTPENLSGISAALNSARIDATLFIESRYLGLSGITERDMLTLKANGFDIQSAGHTGDDLRALTNAQVELELKQSRQLLEEYVGRTVFAIAYPDGGVNDRIAGLAEQSGYLFGVSNANARSFSRENFLELPSFTIAQGMTDDEVAAIAKGEQE